LNDESPILALNSSSDPNLVKPVESESKFCTPTVKTIAMVKISPVETAAIL